MRNAVSSGRPAMAGERRITARWSTTMAMTPMSQPDGQGDPAVGGRRRGVVLDRLAGVDEQVVEGEDGVERRAGRTRGGRGRRSSRRPARPPTSWASGDGDPGGGEHPAPTIPTTTTANDHAPGSGGSRCVGVNRVVSGHATTAEAGTGEERVGEAAAAHATPTRRVDPDRTLQTEGEVVTGADDGDAPSRRRAAPGRRRARRCRAGPVSPGGGEAVGVEHDGQRGTPGLAQ